MQKVSGAKRESGSPKCRVDETTQTELSSHEQRSCNTGQGHGPPQESERGLSGETQAAQARVLFVHFFYTVEVRFGMCQ